MKRKKLVVLGLGQRGNIYAEFAKENPDKFELVAIIENNMKKHAWINAEYPDVCVFSDYHCFLKAGIAADIVAVATQDKDHKEHAVAMMQAGYDLLLEKPIANNREDCLEIYRTSKTYNRQVIVCHVLRYTPFYSEAKRILRSGELGEVVTVHASENVGYWHQAHSFVRGPWRNSAESSPMILAKCCHDMDILRYLVGEPCVSVNSYGGLYYFNREHAPKDSAEFCSQCSENSCVYKAQRLYTEQARWASFYFTTQKTTEGILCDLRKTEYDRCVFKCDNDVVDHQVTIMQFEKGKTACHTMTAFSKDVYRDLKVYGTKAELVGNVEDNKIELRFFGGRTETIIPCLSAANMGGHMGGDYFLMENLYKALNGEPSEGITYLDVSIESHLMSFAAEQSRLKNGCRIEIEK